jgi:hypothetical protein
VDLLGDGHTSFLWTPSQLINNIIGIVGASSYGIKVYASTFTPGCDPYATSSNGMSYLNASAIFSDAYISVDVQHLDITEHNRNYPLGVFQNITNQPIFGNGFLCDRQVRLFNNSLTTGAFQPKSIKARISANLPPAPSQDGSRDVFGYQFTTPFIEYNWLSCHTLKGYQGTGSGD